MTCTPDKMVAELAVKTTVLAKTVMLGANREGMGRAYTFEGLWRKAVPCQTAEPVTRPPGH